MPQVLELTPAAIIHRIKTARDKVHVDGDIRAINLEHQVTIVNLTQPQGFQPRAHTKTGS